MDFFSTYDDTAWWMLTLPVFLETQNISTIRLMLFIFITLVISATICIFTWAFSTGGPAWKNGRNQMGRVPIPGIRGLPIFGSLFSLSHGLAHRTLASMASTRAATHLMAFSLGSTPTVVASDPLTAHEILTSPHFANRPIKQSAKLLMFSRAIGFAPNGTYWRLLRKVASSHLFAPRRILEASRRLECAGMLSAITKEQSLNGFVILRKHLQNASLNNIMEIVFGKKYDVVREGKDDQEMKEVVREGFELLGGFNWSDHLPWLNYFYDPFRINERCMSLVPRVSKIVKQIIEEHRVKGSYRKMCDNSDFVDVLLSLEGEEKLDEDDMVAILWEMIFRGTDTTALLTEWIMAELVLNPQVQLKLHQEIGSFRSSKPSTSKFADVSKLPYLQAIVKETLRVHPPGPLLSWARLATSDAHLSNGMVIPANTTAMVNMWAITHDPSVWVDPLVFKPERFIPTAGGANIDVRGGDLRLAPFGAGRRVCPGKNLGLATVSIWVAELVQHFKWVQDEANPVDLTEMLKLSCEMKNPLSVVAIPRVDASKF